MTDTLKCEICGKEFTPYPNIKNAKYCSNECRAIQHKKNLEKYRKKRVENKYRTRTCPICGESFEAVRNELYCSKECKTKAQRMRRYNLKIHRGDEKPKKKVKVIKGLDDLMEVFKQEGKTPYDYHDWKVQQALKHVSKIEI